MSRKVIIAAITLVSFFIAGFSSFSVDRVMLRMESHSLQGGKAAGLSADLFYLSLDGRLITKLEAPVNQVMITNRLGELSIYDPEKNTVYRTQSLEYSSENNLIYYFLNGKIQDLGLSEMGFTRQKVDFEEGLMITQWMPPSQLNHLFLYIELVHEDYMPIYAGYYDATGEMVKKVYYSEFEIFADIILPMRLTEFNYLPSGDSIINRVTLSDVRFNRRAVSSWFDFEIPEDASIID
jgi:outer membrane lipoprotein-sorting protein